MKFVKKVYVSEIEGPRRRGKSVVIWKDREKKYMLERGVDKEKEVEQVR